MEKLETHYPYEVNEIKEYGRAHNGGYGAETHNQLASGDHTQLAEN